MKEKEQVQDRRGKMQSSQDPHPHTATRKWSWYHKQRSSLRREGLELHIEHLSPGDLHQEDLAPSIFGFANQWNLHPGKQEGYSKQRLTS